MFFGGAGVSTESGISDFRSSEGLFMQDYQIPPEQIVSHSFFVRHPEQFYDFYCNHMVFPDAQPNQAHRKLAELEQERVVSAIITQNVDGLHQKAGSKRSMNCMEALFVITACAVSGNLISMSLLLCDNRRFCAK